MISTKIPEKKFCRRALTNNEKKYLLPLIMVWPQKFLHDLKEHAETSIALLKLSSWRKKQSWDVQILNLIEKKCSDATDVLIFFFGLWEKYLCWKRSKDLVRFDAKDNVGGIYSRNFQQLTNFSNRKVFDNIFNFLLF